MSYFEEDLNANQFFSDETEEDEDEEEEEYSLDSQSPYVLLRYKVVVESDVEEEDYSDDEACYDPSGPAYFQLLPKPVEMPERIQPARDAKIRSKRKGNQKERKYRRLNKQVLLGGLRVQD
mmetsp:Transcript_13946/g.29260  ORF Transcript_13946/g.29260 Transcript_13946/m.29260 type:complete len:121 (+) Transcript_13946:1114-1476(+)